MRRVSRRGRPEGECGWTSTYALLRFDERRPLRRRADSMVIRGLESLPVRFD